MSRIKIMAGDEIVEGMLNDTPGAKEFLKALPVKGYGHRWDEGNIFRYRCLPDM